MFESDSTVYWRRRGVAIASVVAAVMLLVWAMSGPSGSSPDEQAADALTTAGVSLQSPADDPSPVPPAGEPVGVNGQPGATVPGQPGALPGAGLPASGVPATGQPGALPTSGLPATGLPGSTLPSGLPANGVPTNGLPGSGQAPTSGLSPNGLPTNGLPTNGLPSSGLPSNRVPSSSLPSNSLGPNGVPSNGLPSNGLPSGIPNTGAPPSGLPGTSTATGHRSAGQLPSTAGTNSGQPGVATSETQNGRAPAGRSAQGRPPTAPAAPAAPVPCSDKAISVQAQTGADSYKVGQKPRFQLMVTNVSSTPCTRDLDPGLQEMVVTGPNHARLWSSNDCFPAKRGDVRTLQPGKPQVFPLDWAGRTSKPGCAGERTSIGPGSYVLTGKLGSLTSGPARFTIVK